MLRCSRTWIVIIACSICIAEIVLRWIAADASVYFSLLFRFDALIYGAFLALLITEWKKTGIPAWAGKLLWTILATSAIAILCILILIHPVLNREVRSSPLFLAFGLPVFSLGAAALMGILVLEAGSDRWFARLLRWSVLQFVGTVSYAVYLIHVIALTVVIHVTDRLHGGENTLIQAVIATLLSILLAYASWHYLEGPALRFKDRHFPNSPHPPEPGLT